VSNPRILRSVCHSSAGWKFSKIHLTKFMGTHPLTSFWNRLSVLCHYWARVNQDQSSRNGQIRVDDFWWIYHLVVWTFTSIVDEL